MTPERRPNGEERLKKAIARRREARSKDPQPYDDDWGWWVERRLRRLESGHRWIIGIAGAILVAELARIAAAALFGW